MLQLTILKAFYSINCRTLGIMKYLYLLIICCSILSVNAQSQPPKVVVPIQRQLLHDKIYEQQLLLDKADGKADTLVTIGSDDAINLQLTDAVFRKVNALKDWIELNDNLKTNQDKVRFLDYTKTFLERFRQDLKYKKIQAIDFPVLLGRFEDVLKKYVEKQSALPLFEQMPFNQASIISRSIFEDKVVLNADEKSNVDVVVYKKFVSVFPDKILPTIAPYTNFPFADSLISIAARKSPSSLYDFAQNKNSVTGALIHRSKDSLVMNIAQLSQTPNSMFYFPLLDDILSGKLKIDSVKLFVGDGNSTYDSIGYYKLLVQTAIGYHKRLVANKSDTAINMFGPNGLYAKLKDKSLRHFVNNINELHNSPENVRMRAVEKLGPKELYYMMVMSENDIYTSSFRHSFNRMIQRLGNKPRTDSLLELLGYDYFKKFIKMSANYNKLDTFLALMSPENSNALMKKFVGGLEEGNSLEDAVDVADSYSSINNVRLKKFILELVNENEVRTTAIGNEKGKNIYGLLKTIFESEDSTKKIDLSATLGIPPIFEIANKQMQDEKGRIIEQVFFYGDDDGRNIFNGFVNSFSPKEWVYTPKKEWVEYKWKKGEVYIYANRPLDWNNSLDDTAQVHLNAYLASIDMIPSIIVHRGHSYWLNGTINRMADGAKVVLLGSCGGYQNLSRILNIAPEAHIISTKEIGTGLINKAILNTLNKSLISDTALRWKGMWRGLANQFSRDPNRELRENWESYVPPYRNLGAIFIKAYRIRMGEME